MPASGAASAAAAGANGKKLEDEMATRRHYLNQVQAFTAKEFVFSLYKWKEEVPVTPKRGKHVPKPRSGHRIVYYNGCIYSFGGYNPSVDENDADLAEDPYWKASKPLFKEVRSAAFYFRSCSRL